MSEPRIVVKSNEPRPPWWKPRTRRAYDEHLATAQRLLGAMWDKDAEERVRQAVIDGMLYGFAVLPSAQPQEPPQEGE